MTNTLSNKNDPTGEDLRFEWLQELNKYWNKQPGGYWTVEPIGEKLVERHAGILDGDLQTSVFNSLLEDGMIEAVSIDNTVAARITSTGRELLKQSKEVTRAQTSILFLAADPSNASRLRLGQEQREIQEKIQLGITRDKFILHQRTSVRPVDISQAMFDLNPTVVHFSGHGTSVGSLCFEDETGMIKEVSGEALAHLFSMFSETVECVLLNACYSEKQAKVIAKQVGYVIGMNKTIGDKAAIAFTVGFYQALVSGRDIKDAYQSGCAQIHLQGIGEHLTPVLHQRDAA